MIALIHPAHEHGSMLGGLAILAIFALMYGAMALGAALHNRQFDREREERKADD